MSAFLVIQLTLLISRLGDTDRASRFGWQMFLRGQRSAKVGRRDHYQRSRGRTRDYVVRTRIEIDILEALPPHLCEATPDAVVVTWDEGEHRG